MKCSKRFLGIIMPVVMIVAGMPFCNVKTNVTGAEKFEIVSPWDNELKGAGYFDIEWTQAPGTVKEYELYIDGLKKATTTETKYEYYTTQVKMYSVFVKAFYTNGTSVSTPVSYFSITKKGLCVNNDMGVNLNPRKMNMGWYYNWGTGPFSYEAYKGMDYVPMIWGTKAENAIPSIASKNYKYLLAYNEPDMGGDVGGSNINVNTAINNWYKFLGNSYHLGAPAPAQSPSWSGGTWFRTFMDSIDHDTIDFIPLHCYYGTYGGAAGANTFLTDVVDKTYQMYHKPIWVTEFAVSGWGYSNTYGRESLKEFMTTVIDGLNARPYVERYSWFSFNTTDENNGASALWTNSTGELTELGEIYANYGNPEGYTPSEPKEEDVKTTFSKRNSLLDDSITVNNVTCTDYVKANGVTATASSQIGGNTADKAIDDNYNSRWESEHGKDPQNLIIDLGRLRNIKQVDIIWENAAAKDYTIQISTDGQNYTTVATIEDVSNGGRYDSTSFKTMQKARYVKINGTARTTGYGYSIYDLAIYGTDDTGANETTKVPTTTKTPVISPTTKTTFVETTKENVTTTTKINTTTNNVNVTTTDKHNDKPGTTTDNANVTTNSENNETTTVTSETTAEISGSTVNPENNYSAGKIEKVKIEKAYKKKSAKKAYVNLKKVSNVKGYQIQVSANKKFTAKKTISYSSTKTNFKVKGLKPNKKYYVRARAYSICRGITVYGEWSKRKVIIRKK